jgi:hypothetical protein
MAHVNQSVWRTYAVEIPSSGNESVCVDVLALRSLEAVSVFISAVVVASASVRVCFLLGMHY